MEELKKRIAELSAIENKTADQCCELSNLYARIGQNKIYDEAQKAVVIDQQKCQDEIRENMSKSLGLMMADFKRSMTMAVEALDKGMQNLSTDIAVSITDSTTKATTSIIESGMFKLADCDDKTCCK